jgi:replicative superfamily II helicase
MDNELGHHSGEYAVGNATEIAAWSGAEIVKNLTKIFFWNWKSGQGPQAQPEV